MPTNPIPNTHHQATPYLSIRDAARALDFYRDAFGATERSRLMQPDGRVGHAEIMIGEAQIMLADEFPEMGFKGPLAFGGTPVTMHLYVADVDAFTARAVAAGATLERPVADQFYGDRSGTIVDPFGHRWMIATHKEDVSEEEMQRRASKMFGGK
jgi:PhnB protein